MSHKGGGHRSRPSECHGESPCAHPSFPKMSQELLPQFPQLEPWAGFSCLATPGVRINQLPPVKSPGDNDTVSGCKRKVLSLGRGSGSRNTRTRAAGGVRRGWGCLGDCPHPAAPSQHQPCLPLPAPARPGSRTQLRGKINSPILHANGIPAPSRFPSIYFWVSLEKKK